MNWRRLVRREMYITAFNVDESRKLAVETDPLVVKAIDALPRARALMDNAKKMVVQRGQGNGRRSQ